jgi:ribonuclease Y
MKLFNKPKFEPKEELVKLKQAIFEKSKQLEELQGEYDKRSNALQESFDKKREALKAELAELENIVSLKRKERAELERPLDEKRKSLDDRDKALEKAELALTAKIAKEEERERKNAKDENDNISLLDEIGEKKMELNRREKSVKDKEEILKSRENDYLLKVSSNNEYINNRFAELEKEKEKISFSFTELKSKEKDLQEREKKILEDLELIKSKREALITAKKHERIPNR